MSPARLAARSLTVGYGQDPVLRDLDLEIPADRVTTLIGPNGCGKSTLLKSLCGLLPYRGAVELAGEDLQGIRRTDRARRLTMLPQAPVAPEGLTVAGLVARGRHPHQSWMSRWSSQDEEGVRQALQATGLSHLGTRPVSALSGGQRQRVWIAMALAQDTPTLLLDEPTTYLDLAYSIEVLRLVRGLQLEQGKTVVMVLHDLNLAIRFSDHLVALCDGRVAAQGVPADVVTPRLLRDVFGLDALVVPDPVTDGPLVVPR
ncbi:ABC transporter ATP-binding protein [Kocuria sp.]|uniref:ABC transporter ATP-binding protein n=1 Tax=Kocuria sp. TaxID=1871328 RepID=UPI0026DD9054|nr:ABC transporter ATP-binding protein [Kocuria sp.]MDO4918117.1 ABC transporter ATP-binding protein [Kocuria sp.]